MRSLFAKYIPSEYGSIEIKKATIIALKVPQTGELSNLLLKVAKLFAG